MIDYLITKNPKIKNVKMANKVLTEYVNKVGAEILSNTAVFKKDSKGVAGFNKFLAVCGIK